MINEGKGKDICSLLFQTRTGRKMRVMVRKNEREWCEGRVDRREKGKMMEGRLKSDGKDGYERSERMTEKVTEERKGKRLDETLAAKKSKFPNQWLRKMLLLLSQRYDRAGDSTSPSVWRATGSSAAVRWEAPQHTLLRPSSLRLASNEERYVHKEALYRKRGTEA